MSGQRPIHLADMLHRALEALESRAALDGPSRAIRDGAAAVLDRPYLRGLLSGSSLGHPLHPILTDLPLGCWTSAALLDLTGQAPAASRRLVGVGVLGTLPTALAGISDWLDTAGAEQRVGLVHAAGNLLGLSCFAGSWLRRRRGGKGTTLSFAGLAVVSLAGWLGGHLSFALGVGVDTNAFDSGPEDWTATTPGQQNGPLRRDEVDGVRLVVTTLADGSKPYAMADRCSHRGGSLSEGELREECVVCPWHGSRFDARNGNVRRGPASAPQPTYEVRPGQGGIEVRRTEHRALRRNAV
jgi:nitrite reductase/ring-hydroxylating ferredoxin subunit/uncharacterized membrane protein